MMLMLMYGIHSEPYKLHQNTNNIYQKMYSQTADTTFYVITQ